MNANAAHSNKFTLKVQQNFFFYFLIHVFKLRLTFTLR